MRALAIVALLASALLAGCSGSKDAPASDSGPTFDDLGLQATSSTGVIRGVVVDEAIRPVAGAKVTLMGDSPQEATSTAQGTFGFDGLPAATYFLKVHKAGFQDAQQSADVVAGVADPDVLKVQLVTDAANMPYYEEYVFDGFIECSATVGAPGVGYLSGALCSFPNGLTEETGNVTQDNFGVFYQLSKKPTWMQSEMVWQSTQAFGGEMNLEYSWDCGDDNAGFLCDHAQAGSSPLLLTANPDDIETINAGDYSKELFVRVFNEHSAEAADTVGVTAEQKFTIYTHVFYGYQPADGWRFSSGDPVPQP
jgi:hypothetical protein